ncbi:hypothetical protein FRB99_008148 [Tulasnella sp. 403]|nr:hypothetical protein FRB99_008148 [Tulasnella sp. 403]
MVALTARTAGHWGKKMWFDKPSSAPHTLPSSPCWWEPIRSNVLEYAGLQKGPDGLLEQPSKLVITYIVRQGRSNALKEEDHLELVEALEELKRKNRWEVNIVTMERYTKEEQLRLAGRTTVSTADYATLAMRPESIS